MKTADLIAIDVHTHAEVSCRQPHDVAWQPYDEAASQYFKVGKRPTIAETVADDARDYQVGVIESRTVRVGNGKCIETPGNRRYTQAPDWTQARR